MDLIYAAFCRDALHREENLLPAEMVSFDSHLITGQWTTCRRDLEAVRLHSCGCALFLQVLLKMVAQGDFACRYLVDLSEEALRMARRLRFSFLIT